MFDIRQHVSFVNPADFGKNIYTQNEKAPDLSARGDNC
jgi:hypothetical protein